MARRSSLARCGPPWKSWRRDPQPRRGAARRQPLRAGPPGSRAVRGRHLPGAAGTRRRVRSRAGSGAALLPDQPRGPFRRAAAPARGDRRRDRPQPRRVDALRVVDPRRPRADRPARRRGPPLRHTRARGLARGLRHPRPVRGERGRQGRGGLPGGADRAARAPGRRSVSAERAERLAERLAGRELDALLVTHMVNVRYLTGFSGTNGLAIVGAGEGGARVFVTDFRYVERAAEEVEGYEQRRGGRDLFDSIVEALPAQRPLRLGFDDAHLPVRRHAQLAEKLGDGVELIAAGGAVEDMRRVKDAEELRRIRAAAALADEAFSATLERGLVGRTERAVALALEDEMRHRGAPAPSFPSIVAVGPHGALPHAEPRDVEIAAGTLLVTNWAAQIEGYCS